MRPIRLELEGFTCFKKKTEIDFKDLDLFAITGPTGSGKTSLLDAVIFALYGRTPRLGPGQASDLISQGMLRLSVLLEFRASGRRWRIVRTLRHTARATVGKPRLEVYKKDQWESRASSASQIKGMVENIVGLDFDGFTKSVVLPQGEFDRFLKGTPSERRTILTELLGLHVYEAMGRRARELAQIAANTAQVKQEQLDKSLADATPQARKELGQQLSQLTEEAGELEQRLKSIQRAQPLAQSVRNHQSKLKQLDEEIEETTARHKELQGGLEQVQETLRARQEKIGKVEKDLKGAGFDEERFLQLTQLASKAEEWQRLRQRHVSRQRQLEELKGSREALQRERSQAGQALEEIKQALERSRKGETRRQEELDQATRRHGSLEAVSRTRDQARKLPRLRDELDKRRQQLEKARGRQSETARQLESAQESLARAETALRSSEDESKRLRRLHSAEDLRRHLEEGEPCPVCLQEVSELPVQGRHQALEEAEEAERENRQAALELRDAVSGLKSRLQALPREMETLAQAVQDQKASLLGLEKQVEETLGDSPQDASADLNNLLDHLTGLREALQQAVQQREQLEKEEVEQGRIVQRAVHNLELKDKEAESLGTRESEDAERLEALRGDFREWLEKEESLQGFLSQLRQQQEARDLSRRLEEQLSSLREEGQDLASDVQRLKDRLQTASEGLKSLRERRGREEQTRLDAQRELSKALNQLLEELPLFQSGQGGQEAGGDPVSQLEQERSRVEGSLNELRSRLARGEERLEQLKRRIEEARQLRREIKEEKGNAALAKELGLLLRANQLISFIQEEAFRRLAEDGTRHLLELSSQRYSFQVEGDHFAVLDHWNADEARPVNTLSGGESFLASLALALALAESLTEFVSGRQELSLDSLFLDEGFSTLDQETLDIVVQSVETLAGGDRLIGVISHVPELAERFPSRIQVSKSIAGSSIEVE